MDFRNRLRPIRFPRCRKTLLLVSCMACLFQGIPAVNGQVSEGVIGAEQSFKFIASTLQSYRRSSRIEQGLAIPETEVRNFIELLERHYVEFTLGFSPESSFCNFYHHPDNAIMEIEERAGLAFQFLPALHSRLERYLDLDRRFQQQLREGFGEAVLENVQRLKPDAVSFEYLPTTDMDGSETVNFADTACR